MEIENEFIMSQDGYASIDFTLLDRPNNNIASAPEATAVLLPDGHATDSSFPSFELLDGSGVVGPYGYAPESNENQSLKQSRDGSEKQLYKEQAMHSNADDGVAASDVDYADYQIPHPVSKPVSSVDFFAKTQAPQPQEQQSQLSLFGSDGAEENQEFFEAGQTSQQPQPAANSWWVPENTWMANNNQREQSQVYNWAAMTEDQRRAMQLKIGGAQSSSEYPGAMYSMPQSGLFNGSGFPHAGSLAQNMGLAEQQRYRAMMQEASSREQQMREQQARMQEARNREHREQQLRMQEASSREQQMREQQMWAQEARNREHQLRMQEANSREQLRREQQLREQQALEQQRRIQQETTTREQQLRMQEVSNREQQLRLKEASSREQQLRMHGQQNQNFNKYDNQTMEVSPLKVSDYDFLSGDYTMKGQPQSDVRQQQLDEGEAQMWRQQQQQQQQQQRHPLPAWQQPRQLSSYANNTHEDLQQRQQAQAKQRLQQRSQQQQLFAGNQNQASGNQFQAFLGEGSLHDLPQVMQQQPERVNPQHMGIDGQPPFMHPNLQAVNQNNAGSLMYSNQNETGAGQGSINYLLGQDNSFSWHQLAMKASGLDQSMHASAATSSKTGQQSNPYANVQGGGVPAFLGGLGKHPAPPAQINRPIPRSLGAGPSPLLEMEGRSAVPDLQPPKAKMLFGQAMQQQSQPQAVNHMQGFPGSSHLSNHSPANRQVLEEAQRLQQQNIRGNAVQQDGAPHVKLFSQSLTSLDPIQQQQQQQQQQHNLMVPSRNAQGVQGRPVNMMRPMPQARSAYLAGNFGHNYQQGIHQAGGSFLQNVNDRKQQPMWNNYEMDPDASQVEVPVVLPGNTDSTLKSNSWSGGSEGHGAPDTDNSLAFERSKVQQNAWGAHGAQPSNSQSSGELGSRHHNTPSGSIVQQGTPKSTAVHPLAAHGNSGIIHPGSLQSGASMMELSELEANGRQPELQNSQEESNWRNHSLLQASSQQSVPTNPSFQAFTDIDRGQTSWKSLWQSVQNSGNSNQLSETVKEQQSAMWAQNNAHVARSQSELSDDPNARVTQGGWGGGQGTMPAAISVESQRVTRDEHQVMLSRSPQPVQGFQDVDGRQQLNNQGPSFQEAMSQASLSENDPSPASRHIDQASSFSHRMDRDGNAIIQNPDPVVHSANFPVEHQTSMSKANFPVEHQTSMNKANLQNQGRNSAWASDTRHSLDDTVMDGSGQQEGRLQLQLSNQQAENRLSSMMNAGASSMREESSRSQPLRSMNAVASYRHQNGGERFTPMNGATDDAMAGWAHAANQIRTEQSKVGVRALQPSNVGGNVGKEYFTPPRPGSACDEHTAYANSMLAHRARYSGRRDMGDPGRNTLELLNQAEQGEKIGEAMEEQDGTALEDAAAPVTASFAHLRPGPMGTSPLQRPTPSRPELMSREQVELQLSRNNEGWHQGRNLMHEFSRQESTAYAQAQMQSQMQAQMQAQNMRAAQLQAENLPRHGPMQDRMAMKPALLGVNRHFPNDMSRQKAENLYKSLSQAAKMQFQQQLQQSQRANAAAHSMDHPNMSSGLDPRIAAQQHMSRVGFADRPAMPAGISTGKQSTTLEMVAGQPGQVGVGLAQNQPGALQQLQQMKQATPVTPLFKKRKEYPPLVPWRTTISQGSTNLPTTSRAEMEWAAATNSVPDQERFNDAVETLDITAMCVKRAKRRLKFTTQLMQQIVPALPCQLFKESTLDDYKSATFVLAKFAVSEACWLATGLNREIPCAVAIEAIEESAENGNGDNSSVKSEQQLAVVKRTSALGLPSKLKVQFKQKMTDLQGVLSRLERAPTASKLSRELHDLDKLVVLNRMARVNGNEFVAGLSSPNGSPRGKLEAHREAPLVYSPENAYPERFVAAVFVPQRIPDNLMLLPL
ncbi:uncharacterized protein [Physcomitrium patens]|uniref:Uncharacterized protein n=1 Tax=Physcomitrium patens TaxID=3218 RepID=A0A2K1JCI8_PHYPA|nr:uncharacterized protein LOC112292059 isoform X2 [Physcomitrium patens]PNR39246.1 hypothetical protein PHYPA_019524 [Physcomitrium patens]|eukprot:XP_024395935.1 uncharacterized protein LOC112292059 isoform X2 [Physcomitrella patens]